MSTCVTILTTLSLAACAVSTVIFFARRARFRRWHRATGQVIEHVLRSTRKLDRKYAPRVSYEVAGGGAFEFVSSFATNVPPAVGETVHVLYDPERPGRAVLDQFTARHGNEFFVFVLGAVGAVTFGAEFFSR